MSLGGFRLGGFQLGATGWPSPMVPGGFTGLLDQFSGAAAAYSLRKLSKDTTNVVRVRRSSDDTEQDFTANQVSDGSLVDFANNGTSDLYGELMYFDGVDDYISLDSEVSLVGDFDITWKCLFKDFSKAVIFGDSNIVSNDNFVALTSSSQLLIRATDNNSFITLDSALAINTEYVFRLVRDSGTITLYIDGVAQTDTDLNASNLDLKSLGTGGYSGGTYLEGLLFDLDFGQGTTFDGTIADGDSIGTVNGSPELFTGQGFDGFVTEETDQSGATLRTAAQTTTTEQPQIVSDGALVTDGNGNVSTIWDGVDDDLDVSAGFSGLTAANVYAVTDNAGTVTLDTLTSQDISADTNLSTVLSGLTYDKVTAVIIYPDNTNQAAIESAIESQYGI